MFIYMYHGVTFEFLKMEVYLSSTSDKLKTKQYSSVTAVLGNESCDLDSAVSSLVYAIFLHWQYLKIRCGVCTRTSDQVKHEIFIPVLDVDREDYELKTEVAYCFDNAGIKKEDLIFRDDVNLKEFIDAVKTSVVLVDHHNLSKQFDYLSPYVTEIIDHRPLDRSGWNFKEDTRSTIEVVGSCCTLVAQRIKGLSALVADDVSFFKDHPVCADLLHSCILLDTVNFSKEVNKATPLDEEIVLFLETILKPQDYESERQAKVARLVAARSDVGSLSAAQLLRKDAKVVGGAPAVLVPSLPVLVEELVSREGAAGALRAALARRGCSAALLLGVRVAPLRRDLAVYAPGDSALEDALVSALEQWSSPPLQLVPGCPGGWCRHYRQGNLSASRKQYIPALAHFLAQL